MPTRYKRTIRKRKNRHNRTVKRRHRRTRGGLFGSLTGALNSGDKQNKPGQENTSYITKVKRGWFNTKTYNIEYIILNNYKIFKGPDTLITPRFNVHIGDKSPPENCYIQITNPTKPNDTKFVEYFICIDGNWYAMMRVFGINKGAAAPITNTLFYQMQNDMFDLKTNKITLWDGATKEISRDELLSVQKVVLRDPGRIVRLLPSLPPAPPNRPNPIPLYKEITSKSGEIFNILWQFRNAQGMNEKGKEEIAELGVEALLEVAKM